MAVRKKGRTLLLAGLLLLEPVVAAPPSQWPEDPLDWRTSPVDLSFLNAHERPAGKRGFAAARGDRLVFEDGSTGRFWGTNLTAAALFSASKENAKRHARRLSMLGFNLVRLHHHDSPWVDPNIFGGRTSPDTRHLSDSMLEKLDWWIKCLKDEGIYVWLDLHVERSLKPGDGVEAFDEISKGKSPGSLKGYNYVNPAIVEAMKRFNELYVGRINAFTGVPYRDEPAIVAMLVTNENDITNHFGSALLPDRDVPWHSARYMSEADAFARSHDLAAQHTWRSWEPGPSKIFLNDLERRFNREMIGHLRSRGVGAPIAATSTWGRNPLSSLPSLTVGDIIDVHSYGRVGELDRNPQQADSLVHWIAAAQVAGKPLSVTEWNVLDFPAPDRHSAPVHVAAAASHQGWDALMQYAYAQTPLDTAGKPSNWHSFNDPALLASLPAAALLYRRGDVKEASTVYVFAPTREQLFYQRISPENAVALRSAAEIGKLVIALPRVPELPWLAASEIPRGARIMTDPKQTVIPQDAVEAVADTGELRRNWVDGTYVIDTPRTQVATGRIGGRRLGLADVDIDIATGSATVAVQSLTENPIRRSTSVLISLGARSVPESAARLPYRSEPVVGRIRIRAPAALKLYAGGQPGEGRELPVAYAEGRYVIELRPDLQTHWLLLQ